ncbi:proline-rich nuclear receptor coactivator 2-like [Harmonia axyridis]|uniref:proline-rich nuclear receptor coactivator 2-like n=1 Tax=Harmonia axyridis TaxID=115357 RepID=UPI001E279765|nr:proline-rich nuclear receptor coactivator 2-like [Harmonia axyridis]
MAKRNVEGNNKIKCDNTRTNNKCSASKTKSPVQDSKNYRNRMQTPELKDQYHRAISLSSSPKTHSLSPNYSKSSTPDSKQYAGCKWSEPPSPSTLPQPPLHWMQKTSQQFFFTRPFQKCQPEQDIAHQLKVLLNVQA